MLFFAINTLFIVFLSFYSVLECALGRLVEMAVRTIGLATGKATRGVVASSPYHMRYVTYYNP